MSSTSELREVFESVTETETVTDEQDSSAVTRTDDPEEIGSFDVESARNDSIADVADDMEVNVR